MDTGTLAAAIAARTAAAAKLEAAAGALERGKEAAAAAQAELTRLEAEEREWIARDARRRVERAIADAGPAPSLIPTDKAFLSRRKAEVTLAAELQAVSSLEATEREAREALATAEAAAREAARAVLFSEIGEQFEEFRSLASEFATAREGLFAAYLGGGRAALAPRQWLELDNLLGSSAELLQVGLPWLEIPLRQLQQVGGGPELRVKAARARIDRLIPEFQARLDELANGEESAERREDVAA
jgi:hypothetical protein